MQGFILQGSLVDTGLKGFFEICKAFPCNGKVFLQSGAGRASARKPGRLSGEQRKVWGGDERGGDERGGVAPRKWYK